MNIYVSKDNQQLGPYTVDQARQMVTNGALQPNDWAWYDGSTDWVPLQQVPGFSAAIPAPYVPAGAAAGFAANRPRRPILVWVICIFYFIFGPLGLICLAAMPYLLSFAADAQHRAEINIQRQLDRTTDPDVRDRLTAVQERLHAGEARMASLNQRGILYYAVAGLTAVANTVAAVFLFLLRRPALYLFLGGFAVALLQTIYLYGFTGFYQNLRTNELIINVISLIVAWSIAIAIIFYVWLLYKRGVLR